MSGTEDVMRQDPYIEVLGSTHESADRSKLGGYSLGKAMGASLREEVGTYRGSNYGLSGGNGHGKLEGS